MFQVVLQAIEGIQAKLGMSEVVNLCSKTEEHIWSGTITAALTSSARQLRFWQDVNWKAGQQSLSHQTTWGRHCFCCSVSSPVVNSIELSNRRCAHMSLLSVLMRIPPKMATSCSEFQFSKLPLKTWCKLPFKWFWSLWFFFCQLYHVSK